MVLDERQELITSIYTDLFFLKEDGIVELIKQKRADEIRILLKSIPYWEVKKYTDKKGCLCIKWEDFNRKKLILPLLIYVNQAGISDEKIFENRILFIRQLEKYGNDVTKRIAKKMAYKELCEMTIEEMVGLA